ncbi:hypothetical protein [Mangrovibrevibacter kandeliae]|uniref:hypothetical protein n=1 Tax=Mangrovibrevibacter kandeliae TaxID=2968473 RepID=UPI0021198058|nr:hypothetical protein [Aurantimonas sp. CSK15Z-1]MCQ8781826.1 hypothetical protein [Aurantimonas sp. CSK15Z-1]
MKTLAIVSAALIGLTAAGAASAQTVNPSSNYATRMADDNSRLAVARGTDTARFGSTQTFGYAGHGFSDPVESASVVPGSSYAIRTNEQAERDAISASAPKAGIVDNYSRTIPVPGSDGF